MSLWMQKEDKHWEEMDEEGAQEKENEEQQHARRMRRLKKQRLTKGHRVNEEKRGAIRV